MSEIAKRCCGECRCETPEDTRKCPVKIYAVAFAGGAGTANMASLIQQKPHITLWDLRE